MTVSDQDLEEALGIAAKIVDLYGYTYWPIFERLETELTERSERRLKVLARLSQSRPVRRSRAKAIERSRGFNDEGSGSLADR